MSTLRILNSEFLGGTLQVADLPTVAAPEVALIGRSNSGKSTLVNRLLSRNKLAISSRTPGKTQEINLFMAELEGAEGVRHNLILADLPGFGYAKFSKSQRSATTKAIERYVSERPSLCGAFLLNDAKRAPETEELAVQRQLFTRGIPLFIVMTKVDRLNLKERGNQRVLIANQYCLETQDILESGTKTNANNILERISQLLGWGS